jgi:hypothetical protein
VPLAEVLHHASLLRNGISHGRVLLDPISGVVPRPLWSPVRPWVKSIPLAHSGWSTRGLRLACGEDGGVAVPLVVADGGLFVPVEQHLEPPGGQLVRIDQTG